MYSAIRDVLLGRRRTSPAQDPVTTAPPEAAPKRAEPPGPVARLYGGDGPALILIGRLLRAGFDGECYVQDRQGAEHKIPEGYGETLEHLRVPRYASELEAYCARYDLDVTVFRELETGGLILRVDTSGALKAVDCFTGLALVSKSLPGLPSAAETTGPVAVHNGSSGAPNMFVSRDTAEVLWADIAFNLDLPTAVSSVGPGVRRVLTAERVLTDMPKLLELDLAELLPPSTKWL